MAPQLDLLMPSFNSARHLPAALDSAVAALKVGERLLVQDGGSTDATLEILQARANEVIDFVSESDAGQANALNKALARSGAEWIGWLNADDTIEPGAIERLRETMGLPAVRIVFGDYGTTDDKGTTTSSKRLRSLSSRDIELGIKIPFSGSFFVRRDYLNELGGFNEDLKYCMDYELYLRAWKALSGPAEARYISGRVGSLRIYEGTKTSAHPWGFVSEAHAVRRGYATSSSSKAIDAAATVMHSMLVASTPLRSTAAYRMLRS